MKYITTFISILGLLVLHSYCETENVEESIVVPLGDKNFSDFVNSNQYVHVLFYAPWCGYCKALAPEYEKAAQALKGEAILAKVDATVENELADKFEIMGFPTVKFFKNGKFYTDFDGDRVAEDIIRWTRKRMGPPSTLVSTKEEFESFLKRDSTSHIVKFLAKDDTESLKLYESVADHPEFSIFEFAHVVDDGLKKELNQEDNTLAVYVRNEVQTVLKENLNEKELIEWIDKNAFPKLETLKLTQEFVERTARRGRPLLIALRNETKDFSLEDQFNFMKRLSETPLDIDIHFLETEVSAYPDIAIQWGASGEKYPTFILVRFPTDSEPILKAYDEEMEVTEENVINWVKSCVAGKECRSHIRSEKLTEKELNDSVLSLTGKTFKDVVYDDTKDVFVKIYSPDCPHCILMAKEWRKLSRAYENVDSVVIAWINGVANTLPDEVPISGYPTLLLFKAGDKQNPITYSGTRKYEEFSKFLLAHAGTKIDQSLIKTIEEENEEKPSETPQEDIIIGDEGDIRIQVDDTSEDVSNDVDKSNEGANKDVQEKDEL